MGSSQWSEHFKIKHTHTKKKSRKSSGILQSCLSLLKSRRGVFFRAGLRMHLRGAVQLWLLLPGRQGSN